MAEEENLTLPEPPLPSLPEALPLHEDPPPETSTPPAKFDPSRMIGIIKRKALIKDLAAAYHAECLTLCREVMELQKRKEEALSMEYGNARKWHETGRTIKGIISKPFLDTKASEDLRKETLRPSSKRAKKKR